MILKTDHTLWATGASIYGQFGDGTTNSLRVPKQVMADVKQVSTDPYHTLVLKNDNTVWVTGLLEPLLHSLSGNRQF